MKSVPVFHHHSTTGTGPLIVMLHGNSASSELFAPTLTALQNEASVLRIDLLGHGRSPRASEPDYRYRQQLHALEASLLPLTESLFLVGHSLGGHLAMDLAPRLPRAVGLAFCGAAPLRNPLNLDEAFHPVPHIDVMFSAHPPEPHVRACFQAFTKDVTLQNQLWTWFQQSDPKARAALAVDVMENSLPDSVASLRTWDRPQYMLTAADDPVPNVDYVRSLDIDIQFRNLNGRGHYPMIDNPEDFARVILDLAR